ncbi:MAG: hypothetical protein NTU63_03690 [Candidatus Pacearchaeota archaeon]|nr:hypothetical protein [Candidatus Pacearchaeota archaeon]
MKRLLLLSLFIVLISIGFIQGANQIVTGGEISITQEDISITQEICVEGGTLFNDSKICYDKGDDTIYAKEFSGLYSTIQILMVIISEENNLRRELDETKKELDNVKKELKNLEEIFGIKNDSKNIFEENRLENSSQIKNNSNTKNNKGILGFFKRIFNCN